ncbi:TadE/TadG family type IV pilus assembly protein [Gymnodinialimonas sp. 57CJ19]|uniref:TadE/TadG family type IV pilus assembly protein n=1 Tax=Gymnodinialimonas sp. 57CJ19 TaxID=3138498 RepID=UPI0031343F28
MSKILSPLLRFFRRETGAVAIEFVLLAPLLFGLLFGIIFVGYAMALSHSVQQLASASARASVAGITTQERTEIYDAYIEEASSNYPLLRQEAIADTPTITGSDIRVEISYAVDGSLLDLASGILGMELTHLEGSAYVAY